MGSSLIAGAGQGSSLLPWSKDEKAIDEHLVIKTLVMEDEKASPMVVLMHGDREVATGTRLK